MLQAELGPSGVIGSFLAAREAIDKYYSGELVQRMWAGEVTWQESFDRQGDLWDYFLDGRIDDTSKAAYEFDLISDDLKSYWKTSLEQMRTDAEALSLVSAGAAVAQGFADGIESQAEKAALAAERMALPVRDKVSNTMRIASPSKVMFGLGAFISEGLALGISSNESMVASAMDSMLTGSPAVAFTPTSATGTNSLAGHEFNVTTSDPYLAAELMRQQLGEKLAVR